MSSPVRERVLSGNGFVSLAADKKPTTPDQQLAQMKHEMMALKKKFKSLQNSGDQEANKRISELEEKIKQLQGINKTLSEKVKPLEKMASDAVKEKDLALSRARLAENDLVGLKKDLDYANKKLAKFEGQNAQLKKEVEEKVEEKKDKK